jgi:acyl carrier protein
MPKGSEEQILEELQRIFKEVLDQPALLITRNSNAMNTLNWDSLAHIELIEVVERHFRVHFALGELQELKEVGDLIDLISEKRSKLQS